MSPNVRNAETTYRMTVQEEPAGKTCPSPPVRLFSLHRTNVTEVPWVSLALLPSLQAVVDTHAGHPSALVGGAQERGRASRKGSTQGEKAAFGVWVPDSEKKGNAPQSAGVFQSIQMTSRFQLQACALLVTRRGRGPEPAGQRLLAGKHQAQKKAQLAEVSQRLSSCGELQLRVGSPPHPRIVCQHLSCDSVTGLSHRPSLAGSRKGSFQASPPFHSPPRDLCAQSVPLSACTSEGGRDPRGRGAPGAGAEGWALGLLSAHRPPALAS